MIHHYLRNLRIFIGKIYFFLLLKWSQRVTQCHSFLIQGKTLLEYDKEISNLYISWIGTYLGQRMVEAIPLTTATSPWEVPAGIWYQAEVGSATNTIRFHISPFYASSYINKQLKTMPTHTMFVMCHSDQIELLH